MPSHPALLRHFLRTLRWPPAVRRLMRILVALGRLVIYHGSSIFRPLRKLLLSNTSRREEGEETTSHSTTDPVHLGVEVAPFASREPHSDDSPAGQCVQDDVPTARDAIFSRNLPVRSRNDIHAPFDPSAVEEPADFAPSLPSVPQGHNITEYMPLETPRYIRQVPKPKKRPRLKIPQLCYTFPYSHRSEDPDLRGWQPRMHPEGALYFYHPTKRAFTEVYLYNEAYLDETEMLVDFINRTVEALSAELPREYDLVVNIEEDHGQGRENMLWQYYFVNHETRSLFWLRPYKIEDKPISLAHFRLLLESWYWEHVTLFPDGFPSYNTAVDELVGVLTFFCIDSTTSLSSIVPYPREELIGMIGLLNRKGYTLFMYLAIPQHDSIPTDPGAGGILANTAALGRMMSIFYQWRYTFGHGQLYARLDRTDTVLDTSDRQRSWLMGTLRLLLFYAPEVQLREIENLYVDRTVISYLRERHVVKLQNEWSEFVLYSTVVLAANVSLLSVPDVIRFPGSDNTPPSDAQDYLRPLRSPAAIASYVSILFSVGSIILGLLLIRYHRTRDLANPTRSEMVDDEGKPDVEDCGSVQEESDSETPSPIPDHEPLAILFSLPYALLIWAMLSFTTSILNFTLSNTDTTTQSVVTAVAFVVLCLTLWCIITFWQASWRTQQWWMTVKHALIGNIAMTGIPKGWLQRQSGLLVARILRVDASHNSSV